MKNFKDKLLSDQAIKQAANIWYDKELTPGRQWNEEIFQKLEAADILFVLVSADYLLSEYCMHKETPEIVERIDKRECAARLVLLRDCNLDDSKFESLTIWPERGQTVDTIELDSPEWKELKTWFKVEICKALVSRYSDRYQGRSRHKQIEMQNKDPDLEVQQDDLMFLHSQYGEPIHLHRRMAIGAIGGVAYGALIALIIKELLFNGNLESRSDEIFFLCFNRFFHRDRKTCIPRYRAAD